jgi:hypothetical protein
MCWMYCGPLPGRRAEDTTRQAVLEGKVPNFHMEYHCDSPERRHWFNTFIGPVRGLLPDAVIRGTAGFSRFPHGARP